MTTVLFVDDEPAVTDALRVALRHHPIRVLTADSAEAGLAVLAEHEVDVVVSDEKMAGVPGSVFLTQVRHDHPDTERVILTGQASVEATIVAINEADVFRFLVKPCAPEEIISCITEALAARESRRSASDIHTERRKSERDLADALGGAETWFQPIYDRDIEVWACEALLRPRSPQLPTPDKLIATASELGRQFDVDRHVRSKVAEALASAEQAPVMFVNLLPESLADLQLAASDDPLTLHAHNVVYEITERAELTSVRDLEERLSALRAVGHRLAIDDLGAGYSGLSSFSQLQPDIVKFDMELISSIDRDRTKARLVRSMIDACSELGITTLAEGVETEAELETLMELGCELYQGYLLAKPAPEIPIRGSRPASMR